VRDLNAGKNITAVVRGKFTAAAVPPHGASFVLVQFKRLVRRSF